ncbi:MAG: GlsB/YeaQ/YmgE family stress response membrane protein [Anaerolinea sp.]|nr:GlsB/YeaQ/YmgE family stress response membrane protein [Anaerolinea sp.]
MGLILPLIIWGVIGWLAGQLLRGRGYGVLVNIALGLAGGIVGGILFRALGSNWGDGGLVGTIIVGVVGSAVLILAGRLLRGGR